ncbi:hypothetical protein DEJ21_11485 [Curtobacterium sp. MCSS17_006]|nr:hypothetical protein DEJ21_11485 [Curtobacterium sp. MCSS17_006]
MERQGGAGRMGGTGRPGGPDHPGGSGPGPVGVRGGEACGGHAHGVGGHDGGLLRRISSGALVIGCGAFDGQRARVTGGVARSSTPTARTLERWGRSRARRGHGVRADAWCVGHTRIDALAS